MPSPNTQHRFRYNRETNRIDEVELHPEDYIKLPVRVGVVTDYLHRAMTESERNELFLRFSDEFIKSQQASVSIPEETTENQQTADDPGMTTDEH